MSTEETKQIVSDLRFRSYVACAWGVLAAFSFLFTMVNPRLSTIVGIVVTTMWTLTRIVREAFDGVKTLSAIGFIKDKDTLHKKE